MAVTTEYLSGGRIQGRSDDSELDSISQTSWKELDRTTLSSTSSSITVSGFAAKDNLMILVHTLTDSEVLHLKLGSGGTVDDGSNYAVRRSYDGGSDSTDTNSDSGIRINDSDNGVDTFCVVTVRNVAAKEKLTLSHAVESNTAGNNVPHRSEVAGKWVNTSAQANVVKIIAGGTLAIGSEVVVLGCDDDEADSGTNFWQELSGVNLSGGTADNLSSGTITAKKYLWAEVHAEASGANTVSNARFNSDGGNNYPTRHSHNGGSDSTLATRSEIEPYQLAAMASGTTQFTKMFIVNASAKEKLVIGHVVKQGTAGAGNNPDRNEFVSKWTNTSSQITEIDFINNDSGSLGTSTSLRVWGSD